MCLLWVGDFSESHLRLRTPSYTFTGFQRWIHMYNQKYRVFHPRGYLSLLATTRHKFSCSTNNGTPLNFVQHIEPAHQPPRMCVMAPFTYTHECNASVHMQCLSVYAMHHATACQFSVTYVRHSIWTIYHVSWTIISKAYNFQTVHLNENILESYTNIHSITITK